MHEEIVDVAVVGAGPAGSASALRILSLRPDARVLLLDAAAFPRDKTCGDGVAAHVFDLFDALGVPDLRPLGPAVSGLRLRSPAGQVVARRCARPNHPIPRAVLDAMLVEAAVARGALLRRHRVRSLRVEADHVVLDDALARPRRDRGRRGQLGRAAADRGAVPHHRAPSPSPFAATRRSRPTRTSW